MKKLNNTLIKKYPKMFPSTFFFECGDGWFWLLDNLCLSIQSYIDSNSKPQVSINQVKEKFGCYDYETEVLTNNGWKYFKDITKNDKIATLKDGKFLEYQHPLNIVNYDYNGKMYKLQTRSIDLLVTPNHKLYVAQPDKLDGNNYHPYKRTAQPFHLETYENLYLKNKKFKKNVEWEGRESKSITIPGYEYSNHMKVVNSIRTYKIKDKTFILDDFLDFLGWYIAEGCSDYKRGTISIACNNTDGGAERERISKVITKLGYSIKITQKDRRALVFKIYNAQLARWLLKNCGHLAPNKKIPNFIKDLSSRQIRILLNSLYLGDGYQAKTSHRLTTVSKQLSDDVQELILKCGDTFREYNYPPSKDIYLKNGKLIHSNNKRYDINWMKLKYCNTQDKGLAKSSFEGLIDYLGKVYCVEVPNHIIYIRRNGKGVWCGNSLRFYYDGGDETIFGMVWLGENLSYKICEECGSTNKVSQSKKGWIRTLCEKCGKKKENK